MTGGPGPGPLLVGLGVALILIGLLFWSGSLSWFGRLPGDIRIERESVRNITRRSTPIPHPAVGGMPSSSARR